jgi:S-adenosylmethionine:tRNA ribosyltransferase-isomerase
MVLPARTVYRAPPNGFPWDVALRVDDFDFDLPRSLIADHPAVPRDAAKLLVVERAALQDRMIGELPRLLRRGDIAVFNDTQVIPTRLAGLRGAARVEVTLHRKLGADSWRAFAKGARRLRPGDRVAFAADFEAEVVAKTEAGEVELRFDRGGEDLRAALQRHGAMPLPPYIKRAAAEARDQRDYQTIYAAREGAVAAPTAGLHFSERLLKVLDDAGVQREMVTLHVGAGTFLPVKVADTSEHRMHSESGIIEAGVAARINAARRAGGRVIAIGTTSLRLLESAAAENGEIAPFAGDTDIFITPGYRFKTVDRLLTNFHLPRSTLFMLVAAFCGLARIKAAYEHAKREGYRFFSYGDACLLERIEP